MLGVVITILALFSYYYWWTYAKEFRKFLNGGEIIEKSHFFWYLGLSFITITPIVWGILVNVLRDVLPISRHSLYSSSFFIILAIIACIDVFQYKQYKKHVAERKTSHKKQSIFDTLEKSVKPNNDEVTEDNLTLKHCIFPIYCEGEIIGQGFVADGYFITAAHVVKGFPSCYAVMKGKRYEFSKVPQAYMGKGDINHDANMIDIALYPCEIIDSPLHNIECNLRKGDELFSYCMHEVMDFSSVNPSYELRKTPAIAKGEEEGYYFYCDSNQYGGSSGSPLLQNNQVVGIMHGGDEKGLCAFLKASIVKNIIDGLLGEWEILSRRHFAPDEIAAVANAEVVSNGEGKSVCFFMKGRGQTYIPLLDSSPLCIGDTVEFSKAFYLTLRKNGKEFNRIEAY